MVSLGWEERSSGVQLLCKRVLYRKRLFIFCVFVILEGGGEACMSFCPDCPGGVWADSEMHFPGLRPSKVLLLVLRYGLRLDQGRVWFNDEGRSLCWTRLGCKCFINDSSI